MLEIQIGLETWTFFNFQKSKYNNYQLNYKT